MKFPFHLGFGMFFHVINSTLYLDCYLKHISRCAAPATHAVCHYIVTTLVLRVCFPPLKL